MHHLYSSSTDHLFKSSKTTNQARVGGQLYTNAVHQRHYLHLAQPQQWQQHRHHHHHHRQVSLSASPYFTADTVTQEAFEEVEYEATRQQEQRNAWASAVRTSTGRKNQSVWEPALDPPLLLSHVSVVLVGPKKPISCGTIARACSCFECADVRIVQPRCQPNTRSSRSVSKGAQWILHRARTFDSLTAALGGTDVFVAMTRWLPDAPNCLPNLPSLLQHPAVRQLLQQPLGKVPGAAQPDHSSINSSSSSCCEQQQQQRPPHLQAGQLLKQSDHQQQAPMQQALSPLPPPGPQHQKQQPHHQQQQQRPVRIALVFGREEYGLSDIEVAACDMACAISIGRLQESLSLSHAVTVVLSQLYQARLSATATDPLAAQYRVSQLDGLAEGYDSSGSEH